MYRAGWRALRKKKAVQNLAVIDTDQAASAHPIDPAAIPKSEAAALHLPNAQRVTVALTVAARSEVATEKAAVANAAKEMANRDQDVSLAKAADASVAPVTTDALQEQGRKDAIGGAVVAEEEEEEAAKETTPARGVAIPRIKPMEIPRGGVRRALLFQHFRVWRG